jgi:diadenosine tetraphosphatase ApaH/serine/threonine PP2A family protein phosphatase
MQTEEERGVQRTVIVGDVHGMLAPLKELLAQLQLAAGDKLIFVGDLVDKGPEPAGVVHHLARLAAAAPYDIVLVDGNHEDRHRRYQRNLLERPVIAAQQAAEAPELPALAAELTEAGRAFLNKAVPFFRLRAHDVLIVHGGIPGDMRRFPAGIREAERFAGRERDRFRKVLRTRFVDAATGSFVGLGQEKPGDPFWADVYDGRFGHVVFGHQPFLDGPAEFSHATGIDTGAVHGGALTALVLPEKGPRSYVQVRTPVFVPRR